MKSIDRPHDARNNDAPLWHVILNNAAYQLTVQERHAVAAIVEAIVRPWEASCVKEALLAGASALRRKHSPDVATAMERAYLSRDEVRP